MVYRNNTGRLGCWLHQCVLRNTLAGSKTVVSTSRNNPVHCIHKRASLHMRYRVAALAKYLHQWSWGDRTSRVLATEAAKEKMSVACARFFARLALVTKLSWMPATFKGCIEPQYHVVTPYKFRKHKYASPFAAARPLSLSTLKPAASGTRQQSRSLSVCATYLKANMFTMYIHVDLWLNLHWWAVEEPQVQFIASDWVPHEDEGDEYGSFHHFAWKRRGSCT